MLLVGSGVVSPIVVVSPAPAVPGSGWLLLVMVGVVRRWWNCLDVVQEGVGHQQHEPGECLAHSLSSLGC